MKPETFFKRRAIDDSDLQEAIPELLRVIDDLKGLRGSEKATDEYINQWRRTKFREYSYLPNERGETVKCTKDNPDMHAHDKYINWLFEYFSKLYKEKTGKTIGYAYAFDTLTVYHNRQLLNNKSVGEIASRPNTDIDDIFDALEKEEQVRDTEREGLAIQSISLPKELNTDEAKELFERGIKAGFINSDNTWNEKKTMYQMAYFIDLANDILNLKAKWKPFERFWGVKNLAQAFNKKDNQANLSSLEEVEAVFPEVINRRDEEIKKQRPVGYKKT